MAYYVSGGEVKQDFSLTNDTMYVYSEGIVEGAVLNNGNLYVAGGAVSEYFRHNRSADVDFLGACGRVPRISVLPDAQN